MGQVRTTIYLCEPPAGDGSNSLDRLTSSASTRLVSAASDDDEMPRSIWLMNPSDSHARLTSMCWGSFRSWRSLLVSAPTFASVA